MDDNTDDEKKPSIGMAPEGSVRTKALKSHLKHRAKIVVAISLVFVVFGAGFLSWLGINGSGLPLVSVVRFHVNAGEPNEIMVGPDGNLWFNYALFPSKRPSMRQIGSVTAAGHLTTIHLTTPTGFDAYDTVKDLSLGPDGAIWGLGRLAKNDSQGATLRPVLWRIEPGTGNVRLYSILSQLIQSITVGRDGSVWYTGLSDSSARAQGIIGRLDPQTGAFKNYAISFPDPLGAILGFGLPESIAEGPDGKIWFTRWYDGQQGQIQVLGRFDPQTGTFRSILLPSLPNTFDAGNLNGFDEGTGPRLLPAPDGGVWVLRMLRHYQGSAFTMLEYVSPTGQVKNMVAPDQEVIEGFALAPNNKLWVVYNAAYHWPLLPIVTQENRLVLATPGGTFTQLLRLSDNASDIANIAVGSGNRLWAVVKTSLGMDIEEITLPLS